MQWRAGGVARWQSTSLACGSPALSSWLLGIMAHSRNPVIPTPSEVEIGGPWFHDNLGKKLVRPPLRRDRARSGWYGRRQDPLSKKTWTWCYTLIPAARWGDRRRVFGPRLALNKNLQPYLKKC
jgi:hypothetical protein